MPNGMSSGNERSSSSLSFYVLVTESYYQILSTGIVFLVAPAGLEPAHLAAMDFESIVSTIPPRSHNYDFQVTR